MPIRTFNLGTGFYVIIEAAPNLNGLHVAASYEPGEVDFEANDHIFLGAGELDNFLTGLGLAACDLTGKENIVSKALDYHPTNADVRDFMERNEYGSKLPHRRG